MPKFLQKIFSAFFGAFLLFAFVLRCVQLFLLTDVSTGFINRNQAGTIVLFFASCLAFILLLPFLFKDKVFKNPFYKSKSGILFYISVAAGIAMFYDFVYKCVNCYKYAVSVSGIRFNYFIPVCFAALSALLCSLYFILMGVSFKTDSYDFCSLRYYHIVPVLWNLFILFSSLSDYNDGVFAEEKILYYVVLISGILFFTELVCCIHSDNKNTAKNKSLKRLCISGFIYGSLCFILSVPRIIAFIFGAELFVVDFSLVTYLIMSVFTVFLSFSTFSKTIIKEE